MAPVRSTPATGYLRDFARSLGPLKLREARLLCCLWIGSRRSLTDGPPIGRETAAWVDRPAGEVDTFGGRRQGLEDAAAGGVQQIRTWSAPAGPHGLLRRGRPPARRRSGRGASPGVMQLHRCDRTRQIGNSGNPGTASLPAKPWIPDPSPGRGCYRIANSVAAPHHRVIDPVTSVAFSQALALTFLSFPPTLRPQPGGNDIE